MVIVFSAHGNWVDSPPTGESNKSASIFMMFVPDKDVVGNTDGEIRVTSCATCVSGRFWSVNSSVTAVDCAKFAMTDTIKVPSRVQVPELPNTAVSLAPVRPKASSAVVLPSRPVTVSVSTQS